MSIALALRNDKAAILATDGLWAVGPPGAALKDLTTVEAPKMAWFPGHRAAVSAVGAWLDATTPWRTELLDRPLPWTGREGEWDVESVLMAFYQEVLDSQKRVLANYPEVRALVNPEGQRTGPMLVFAAWLEGRGPVLANFYDGQAYWSKPDGVRSSTAGAWQIEQEETDFQESGKTLAAAVPAVVDYIGRHLIRYNGTDPIDGPDLPRPIGFPVCVTTITEHEITYAQFSESDI